ncbi:MAG: tRNA (cytidine(34)-2'-O)-methyltransferase [Clostridia bacterium]|nr:tRNA (cytidine(34)-2'-O)-methyltransferase [Clostridia bacterium]
MVNIVLVEPQIPQNTGNVARTCAVTGSRLHLVGPMGFKIDDAKLKRAGLDYWHLLDITYYDSLEDYLSKNEGAVMRLASSKGLHSHTSADYPDGVHLLFGKETAGLPSSLLEKYSSDTVRIPQISQARCLNLSNAVAVVAYEALRQQGFPDLI